MILSRVQSTLRVMREYTDTPLPSPEELLPYGEVALGVECAWPQSLPLLDSMEQERQ